MRPSRQDAMAAADASRTRTALLQVVALTIGIAVLCQWSAWPRYALLSIVNVAVSVAFTVTGVLLGEERGQRRTGQAFVVVGILWSVGRTRGWDLALLPLLASMSDALVWFLLAWALLLYPSGRVSRRLERLWLVLFLIWMPGETLLVNLVYFVTAGDFATSAEWPAISPFLYLKRIEVSDDGVGGADPARGGGLAGLVDRVRALGGELTITSPPGNGTHLQASIPCE
jgi:hypothetical protein